MQQHLKDQLVELRQCLKALPTDIPVPPATESKYKFSDFSPDAEWTIDIGEAGAVNRELEVRFGNCVNNLKLVERGPETEAVVDVLEIWIEKCPGDIILEKWVHDILEAAQSVILAAGKALPKYLHQSNDDPDIELVSYPIKKAKASKKKKIKIVESDVSVMHLYTDAEHKPAKGKGGAKYLKSNPKKMIVRCSGAGYGCATTWAAPRWKTRVFGHALQCGKLDKIDLTLRDRVRTAMAKESLAEDGSSKVDSFDGEDFDAASIINLNSRKLVDVLADKDLAPAAPRSTVVLPPASTIVQERVLTEADWDME
ncbi:hypothetical protein F4604DRAFT_1948665 [Suillus subluteus]|nr:hypothetical protein F4604DRAFT_1948665 [Suillus subluteus]